MTDTTTTENAEDTAGLKAKNTDLLGKLKTANAKATDLETRLAAIEADRDDALDTTKTEAEKERGKLQKQIDKLTTDLTERDTRLSGLLIDNAISDAVAKHGVLPHFVPAVTAMMRVGAKMEKGEAIVGDVPLADHLTSFFTSTDAKHYVAAPANSGAGAMGSTAGASKWSKPPVTGLELQSWSREAVANPSEYNAMAKGWGRPDLEV